jgi:hypothetical protein
MSPLLYASPIVAACQEPRNGALESAMTSSATICRGVAGASSWRAQCCQTASAEEGCEETSTGGASLESPRLMVQSGATE